MPSNDRLSQFRHHSTDKGLATLVKREADFLEHFWSGLSRNEPRLLYVVKIDPAAQPAAFQHSPSSAGNFVALVFSNKGDYVRTAQLGSLAPATSRRR